MARNPGKSADRHPPPSHRAPEPPVPSTLNRGCCTGASARGLFTEILDGGRADYGERILATLSQQLAQEVGRGFDYMALTRMAKFHQAFPDHGGVTELAQTLSWSLLREPFHWISRGHGQAGGGSAA